ncbi:hypothetical protein [Methylacidiphilum caldifontis]|uniref:Uncharacterized protein n=1 Tax=Methylacidiphilum caldifontis TaxID=2795386 RepID=A0A4Y8PA57_9BACT|nr:hypothetical protein [Methylacidiphilum caldifontis]TFE66198.1 hypothetical protein A7Q10_02380 [Methylacidiphilum caldifontis]
MDQQKPKDAEAKEDLLQKIDPSLTTEIIEKSYSFSTEKWVATVHWIGPDGQISDPLPVWIDKNKFGHLFLQASVITGEILPEYEKKQKLSLCQTLSLFRVNNEEIIPIGSPIWIEIQDRESQKEEIWTAEGSWEASSPLHELRNVYSPFKSFLRYRLDPLSKKLYQFEWPDILILLQRAEPKENKDSTAFSEKILINFK